MADAYNPPPVNSPVDNLTEDPITRQKKTQLSFAWNAWFNWLFSFIKNVLTIDGAQTVSNKTIDNTNAITVTNAALTTPLLSGMTTTTTAPTAGAGGALPATPAGYMTISVNGSPVRIAYY